MESKGWSDLLNANFILFLDRLTFKSWVHFYNFYFYSVQRCIKLIVFVKIFCIVLQNISNKLWSFVVIKEFRKKKCIKGKIVNILIYNDYL